MTRGTEQPPGTTAAAMFSIAVVKQSILHYHAKGAGTRHFAPEDVQQLLAAVARHRDRNLYSSALPVDAFVLLLYGAPDEEACAIVELCTAALHAAPSSGGEPHQR